jgi:DNA helicase HerA-like ATPase
MPKMSMTGDGTSNARPNAVTGEAGAPAAQELSPGSKHRLTLGKGKVPFTLGAYEVTTENVVIVGKKATGKSYFAQVLVEEMLSLYRQARPMSEGVSVVIFAPSGGWWGIRAGRSGGARGGHRVLTIGGEHADFPIDRGMGTRIADLADAISPDPILVEMEHLAIAEQQELVADFAERLAMSQARRLLHIVLDEAEDFFPASPVKGPQLRAARALDAVIRKRRARGIAVTTVASRLTNLNRNVTSQAGRFVLFGMVSPQDLHGVCELVGYGAPRDAEQLSAVLSRNLVRRSKPAS